MGKQAKARRKREGWGCTNKRFQPITIRNEPQQSDSDSDGEGWSKLKAKQTTVKGSGSNALCGKKKRKSEAEQKDIDLFLGVKRGGKKRKAGQLLPGRGHPAKGGGSKAAAGGGGGGEAALLPKIEWADKKIAPFKRVFWADGAGAAAPATPAEVEVLKSSRKKIGVVVKGGNAPAPVAELDDERYPESFTSVFEYTRRITEPTPVQQQCWPAILAGSNVLGLAETGSGKTLSYLLPAVPYVIAYCYCCCRCYEEKNIEYDHMCCPFFIISDITLFLFFLKKKPHFFFASSPLTKLSFAMRVAHSCINAGTSLLVEGRNLVRIQSA